MPCVRKGPLFVKHGPWRSAEPASKVERESGHPILSGVLELFFNLESAFYLGELLFGALRLVGHVVIIALHAVFHL